MVKKLPNKPKLPKVSTYVVARFRTYCKRWLNACCLSCWFNKSLLRSFQQCHHSEVLWA